MNLVDASEMFVEGINLISRISEHRGDRAEPYGSG
jgi:hypothetical protein